MDGCLIAVSGLMAVIGMVPGIVWTILAVAGGLGLVIFVHELGHFLAAKACGVKVEKFYVGFDIPMGFLPSSLLKFRWGETEYGIGILPLGGYVKMLGQDDNPKNQALENERIKVRKPEEGQAAADGEFEWDPRSYPAKPVWQRMIIISAGVIMNLIFAVIFAVIAYGQGVSYMPCLLGGSSPGDPAWIAGLQGGDKILQVGRHGQPDEQLRFDKDLMIDVTLNGAKHPLDLLIRRAGQAEPAWISLTPTDRLADSDRPATLGVRPAATTVLAAIDPVGLDDAANDESDEGYAALQPGDEIVAVDGQPLPRDPQTGFIFEHDLDRLLAPRLTEPVTLTIQRPAAAGTADSAPSQTRQVTLPPTPLRMMGLVMEAGPVIGVRRESPAEKAGFREGDVLVSLAGADLGDPLTLRQRLLPLVGQSVEIGVRRAGAPEPVLLQVTPVVPTTFQDGFSPGSPLGVECLGLAFHLTHVVKEVLPDSPAAKAGLRGGDRLLSAVFTKDGVPDGEPLPMLKTESWGPGFWRSAPDESREERVAEKDLYNWYFVHNLLNMIPEADLELTYRRGENVEQTVVIEPTYSDQYFYPARRLRTESLSLVRTAESWSDAWSLGYVETAASVKKVFAVLQRLFTGKLSYRNLGGPIMIVRAAGSEASEGLARLLVFLTFLSANLAVLNFLPIPALDGGHMLFLIAEGVRGKPLNERLQVTLTLIGVGCLLSLMVLVFTLDIQRFF